MFRYIYRYRNKLNGKVYIGQTTDIERRKSEHLKDAERGTGFVFHRALRKYGIDCFDFDVLHVVEGDDEYSKLRADELEKKEIQCHRCLVPDGYNMANGGQGGDNGKFVRAWAQSEEGKQCIRERVERQKLVTYDKVCEVCGKAFVAHSNRAKFCSTKCRNVEYTLNHFDWDNYKVDAVCECCGAPFRADKYAVARGKGRFCSRRCARVSRG